MKVRWVFFLLILAVVIYFGIHFISDVYLTVADLVEPDEKTDVYKKSHVVFPFDHTAAYKYGYVLLKAGYESKNNAIIEESINWFKQAVSRNPFHYYSHYYLGKSYLFHNYPHSSYFNEAIAEFKKAAFIRGSNQAITLDTCKMLLSLWPFLSETDKQFCRDLLSKTMNRFTWEDFAGLVEPWWLYSKDSAFLEELLGKKPEYFFPVAEKLTDLNAPLALRWDFLAKYETFLLNDVNRKYQSLSFQMKSELEPLRPLLENLETIKAYYVLAKDETFQVEEFRTLRNKLLHQVIIAFIEGIPPENRQKMEYTGEIDKYIYEYINGGLPREDVLEFKEYLKKNDFFRQNDFRSLYFAYLLEFKLGNFGFVIDSIESLKKSITFINENKKGDYIQLLLLLADSYQASKLLSTAETILGDIIDRQPDNLDACFFLLRIREIIGGNGENKGKIKGNINSLKSSRKFVLNAGNMGTITEKTVYLFNQNSIEITLENHFPGELNAKLLQVFVEGRIKYENYISLLPPVIRIELKPGTGVVEMSKHRVEVRVRK